MLSVQKIDLINEGKFITLNIKNKTPFNIKLKKSLILNFHLI